MFITPAGALPPLAMATTPGLVRQPYLNAHDFGLIGDGVTDDTTALQSAINAAAALGTDPATPGTGAHNRGATVLAPYGTYVIDQVTLFSHVRLMGHGVSTILLQKPASTQSAMIVKDQAARFSRLLNHATASHHARQRGDRTMPQRPSQALPTRAVPAGQVTTHGRSRQVGAHAGRGSWAH